MRNLTFIFLALLFLSGCAQNTTNLTFEKSNKFRINPRCDVAFDDMRKVYEQSYKNSIKQRYFVEFNNIYESQLDLTQTTLDEYISLEGYVKFLEEEKAHIYTQQIRSDILYLKFKQKGKILHQMVAVGSKNIHIATAEPMMFAAIKNHCFNK